MAKFRSRKRRFARSEDGELTVQKMTSLRFRRYRGSGSEDVVLQI